MLLDQINYNAVLLAAVINMAIGALWYSDFMFGNIWRGAVGLSKDDMAGPVRTMALTALMSLLLAFFMAVVLQWVGAPANGETGWQTGLTIGVGLWLGFAVPVLFIHLMFHQARKRLYAITLGNLLIAFAAMGGAMGALQWG